MSSFDDDLFNFLNSNQNLRFLQENPLKNCGCIIHLIRPGKREVCCKDKFHLKDLITIAKSSFSTLRATHIVFVVDEQIVRGEIPDEIISFIKHIHRPVRYYAMKPFESYENAHHESKMMQKASNFHHNELRVLAHIKTTISYHQHLK